MATLNMDAMANINKAEQIARDAGQYFWGGGMEQPLKSVSVFADEHARAGVKFRFLFPEKNSFEWGGVKPVKNIECRGLSDIPVNSLSMKKKLASLSASSDDERITLALSAQTRLSLAG